MSRLEGLRVPEDLRRGRRGHRGHEQGVPQAVLRDLRFQRGPVPPAQPAFAKCLQIFENVWRACSRLYQNEILQENINSKYAFDSIFQALQDLHTFAPLQSQNFRKKSL